MIDIVLNHLYSQRKVYLYAIKEFWVRISFLA